MNNKHITPLFVALVLIVFCVVPAHAFEGDRITTARKGIGVELKPAYFETAVINVRNAETELDQTSLF